MANIQAREPSRSSLDCSAHLLRGICQIAGAPSLIDDARVGLARHGVIAAVQRYHTSAIFNWLIDALSYQGVSDNIAYSYMEQHGRVRWGDIAGALSSQPSCAKLRGYWAFEGIVKLSRSAKLAGLVSPAWPWICPKPARFVASRSAGGTPKATQNPLT
jgi:hypothetical protein